MTETLAGNQWQPLSPTEVAALLANVGFPWWIAGGHAIEHAVGHTIRQHADIDVLVLRRDQLQVQKVLIGWDCWVADPPGTLRPWNANEVLPTGISDIWCRCDRNSPWRLQIMLDESENGQWHSRRHRSVTKPVAELGIIDGAGIRYLAPEVQLFYKAKAPRQKDQIDFAAALPHLSSQQSAWLRAAIFMAYGESNSWLAAF